jgi:CSLREA domain-containing protein
MNGIEGRRIGLTVCVMVMSALLLALILVLAPAAGARGAPEGAQEATAPEAAHVTAVTPTIEFTAYEGNPVLEGESGSWEATIAAPYAVYTDGVTYLFYGGASNWPSSPLAIGYVTATDGMTFTRSAANPILIGDGSGFDAWSVFAPTVLLQGNTWMMYYAGNPASPHFDGEAVGRATATDPAGPWQRLADPVLERGSPGEWDDRWIMPMSVVEANGAYTMYYAAGGYAAPNTWLTGMATSTDGVEWVKYDDPTTPGDSDPVLLPGDDGQWDAEGTYAARVRPMHNGWEMFYTGENANGLRAIGYAWSADGIHWVKHPDNPIYHPDDDPYAYGAVEAPTILVHGSTYWMYYDCLMNNKLGLATGTVQWPIVVDTTDDDMEDNGNCSLREAIQAANTDTAVDACPAGSGHDIILIPAGTYVLTRHGAPEHYNQTGDLDIRDHLTLQGAGAEVTIIDGDAADRVIENWGVTLEVNDLTITNGSVAAFPGYHGGGLFNVGGAVTLNRCIISGNVATYGGGLDNRTAADGSNAILAVNDSLVVSNTATGNGGGIMNLDAGYANSSVILTVTRSIVADNVADGTYRDWMAGCGGGIVSGVQIGSAYARVTIQESTVSGNVARGSGNYWMGNGGGIAVSAGEVTLINSTVSGNQANGEGDDSGLGGGLFFGAMYAPGTATLVNTTVSDNIAVAVGGGLAGYSYTYAPSATFQNTIIAGNDAPEGAGCWSPGDLISQGYNLEDGDTCNLTEPTDLPNTDPLLGPLQDNGGPTWTHALPEVSPAVDAGSCPGFAADQRGYPRPVDHPEIPNADDGCDIGAFELEWWPIVVDTTEDILGDNDNCSLRAAIQAANTNTAVDGCVAGSGHDTIIIPEGTYVLTRHGRNEDNNVTGDLDIKDHLTLHGAGAELTIIDGDGADRVIHNHGMTLIVNDLTVTKGDASQVSYNIGGGLYNHSGSMIVNRCIISNNIAGFGGGLRNRPSAGTTATLAVNDSLVISNTATGNGAGIMNLSIQDSPNSTAILTVTRSTVADNVATGTTPFTGTGCGGGVASGIDLNSGGSTARVTIQDSAISRNVATGTGSMYIGNGGGILITAGEVTLINSTISGNQANGVDQGAGSSGRGGGVWVTAALAPGSVTLINTTVSDNSAVASGGGLAGWYFDYAPSATFQNTIIAGNDAPDSAGCWSQGDLISQGYNLEDGDTCNFDQPTDLPDTDPLLGPLQDNGGPTWTHALPEASPAVDAGSCPDFTADQRGYPRPVDHPNAPNADDGCDIGAYEVQQDTIAPSILTTEPEDGAVDVALDAPGVITFDEPIDPATLSYSCEPDPGGWAAAWNGLGTVVTLTHDLMTYATVYTVTVTAAADLAGNPLAEPYPWSFTTEAAPAKEVWTYLPLLFK